MRIVFYLLLVKNSAAIIGSQVSRLVGRSRRRDSVRRAFATTTTRMIQVADTNESGLPSYSK